MISDILENSLHYLNVNFYQWYTTRFLTQRNAIFRIPFIAISSKNTMDSSGVGWGRRCEMSCGTKVKWLTESCSLKHVPSLKMFDEFRSMNLGQRLPILQSSFAKNVHLLKGSRSPETRTGHFYPRDNCTVGCRTHGILACFRRWPERRSRLTLNPQIR